MPDAFSNGVDKIIVNIKNFFVKIYNNLLNFVNKIKLKFKRHDESDK